MHSVLFGYMVVEKEAIIVWLGLVRLLLDFGPPLSVPLSLNSWTQYLNSNYWITFNSDCHF